MEPLVETYEVHTGTTAGSDARVVVRQVTDPMKIDPASDVDRCSLHLGIALLNRVLVRVTQKSIMFRPDGVPARVWRNGSFSEYRSADLETREVKRETAT